MTGGGPLVGLKVLEVGGVGPTPFAGMILSDLGAEVVRCDRATASDVPNPREMGPPPELDVHRRGRLSVTLDMKVPLGRELALRLCEQADVLLEGFRPGAMERLGLGPDECLRRNPRLVFVRITGWGQDGPLSDRAGHDINYAGLSGALYTVGRVGQRPVPPLNYLADYGGGGMLAAIGALAALQDRATSGQGQVVDVSMLDGAAMLTSVLFGMKAAGLWTDERGTNLLDSGAPFYDTYETACGGFVAVGALEQRFFDQFATGLGLTSAEAEFIRQPSNWKMGGEIVAKLFKTRTREQWCDVFDGTDACVTPVLSPFEAHGHPQNRARNTFETIGGILQPAPAPKFSRTPSGTPGAPVPIGQDTDEALRRWQISTDEIERLRRSGVIGAEPQCLGGFQ
jgi:alpha-methylacyl-CoA racemase